MRRARLVLLGDVHGHEERLHSSLALVAGQGADLAILAGDVGLDPPWDEPERSARRELHDESVRRVLTLVGRTLGCPVVFVPGNHDLPQPPGEVPALNADGTVVEAAGLRIAGLGGSGPARFGFPYEWSEAEAVSRIETLPRGADVLLCHTPPAACGLDRTTRGEHVGSRAVADWIRHGRPRIFVCGHIHEAWGVERIAGVPCVNAGGLGEPHGQVIAWVVDWHSGPRRIRSLRPDPGGEVRVEDY